VKPHHRVEQRCKAPRRNWLVRCSGSASSLEMTNSSISRMFSSASSYRGGEERRGILPDFHSGSDLLWILCVYYQTHRACLWND
jgi:hypothetical protein